MAVSELKALGLFDLWDFGFLVRIFCELLKHGHEILFPVEGTNTTQAVGLLVMLSSRSAKLFFTSPGILLLLLKLY